jgi:acetyl esterase/lipase
MDIWPAGFLGEDAVSRGVEQESKGDNIIRLTDVEIPGMTVYKAEGNDPRPAVLVLPGGGFSILAMDLEGTEIAEWLNSRGISAAVLRYRVPKNPEGAFADTQRAMSLLRHQAESLGIDPNKIGVIGFSAGGHLAGKLCTNYQTRVYDRVDEADDTSCRPDFAMLVYAYLLDREGSLAQGIEVTAETPPAILIHAQDDFVRAESSIFYFLELKKAGVPAELHVFPSGGHGYGLRVTEHAVTRWPELCNTWLEGILGK